MGTSYKTGCVLCRTELRPGGRGGEQPHCEGERGQEQCPK